MFRERAGQKPHLYFAFGEKMLYVSAPSEQPKILAQNSVKPDIWIRGRSR